MRLAGRVSAAIEILGEVIDHHRPAGHALADWGRTHRFAGSGDRSAIGTLVYDTLRRRASLTWRMGGETPRALVLGMLRHTWGLSADNISALCDGSRHAPEPLTSAEESTLLSGSNIREDNMPAWAAADIPVWLYAEFAASFTENGIAEGRALAERAPVDLRVNTLKADRPRVLKAMEKYGAVPTPFTATGVRIPPPAPQAKNPNVEADGAHGRGWFEVQDEASQIAVALSGAGPRLQVLDLCAGAGGKTLGLGALMQNTGQLHAYDADKTRLRPIFERLKRAGVRNAQVLPAGEETALEPLIGRMDVVFVDAPCSGSGVWRRRPDAKWRLTAAALADRIAVMEAGRVAQVATPEVLYETPGSRFVADFIGKVNLLEATGKGAADGKAGREVTGIGAVEVPVDGAPSGAVSLAVRPEKIRMSAERPTSGIAANGRITDWAYYGDTSHIYVRTEAGLRLSVTVQNATRQTIEAADIGDEVWLTWSPEDTLVLET
jgi:16S rRNA (cytosine967-C5)-methyltransferase